MSTTVVSTTSKNWFGSEHLLGLYKKGKLNKILKKFKIKSDKHWIGTGSNATTFSFNDKEVLKICSKKIHYFEKHHDLMAKDFRRQVNTLKPFVVPINKILYEDKDIFIYTQNFCHPIDNWQKSYFIDLYQSMELMLKNNIFILDIVPDNVGHYDGHLVIFDPHDLRSLDNVITSIENNIDKTFASMLEQLVFVFNAFFKNSSIVEPNGPYLTDSPSDHDITTSTFDHKMSTFDNKIPLNDMMNTTATLIKLFTPMIEFLLQKIAKDNNNNNTTTDNVSTNN
jgi:hypothetical protein